MNSTAHARFDPSRGRQRQLLTRVARAVVRGSTLLLALPLLAPVADAQRYAAPEQVNSTWDRSVLAFQLTPDGERLVYSARTSPFGAKAKHELFVASFDAPIALTPEGVSSGLVTRFELTPDGSRVVFMATYTPGPFSFGTYELYSAPLSESDGGYAATKLNPPLVGPDFVRLEWQLSRDGAWVVFDTFANAIYAVRPDGRTPPILLSDGAAPPSSIAVSPSSDKVAYIGADPATGDRYLYLVPIDGSSPPFQVNGPLAPPNGLVRPAVSSFAFTRDGANVLYLAEELVAGRRALMLAPTDGSAAPTRFNHLLSQGSVNRFVVSPTGDYVVYEYLTGFDRQLWSRAIDGAFAHRTSAVLRDIGQVEFTPNGERVVWEERDAVQSVARHLMSNRAELGFANAIRLDTLVAPHALYQIHFTCSPDSRTAVYTADADPFVAPVPAALKTVPVDGSASPFVVSTGDFRSRAISPDGAFLLYVDVKDTPNHDLYSIPIDGSLPATRVTNLLHVGGVVDSIRFAPDGNDVLFRAQQWNAAFNAFRASEAPVARSHPKANTGNDMRARRL